MKKLWLAAVAGLALSTSAAFAADLGQPYVKAPPAPPPALPTWTGFYIGINGGGGWNKHSGATECIDPTGVVGGFGCTEGANDFLKPAGGLAGGQIGYNWQSGIVVYGIEADIQWADIHDSASIEDDVFEHGIDVAHGTFTASQKLDWFGTVRGRLGITPWSQNALLYVTGGLIYGQEKISGDLFFPATGIEFFASDSTVRTGGTVGVGLEYLFTPNLSGKIEGLWYDMGTEHLIANEIALRNGFQERNDFNFQGVIVRAGLNWHFNWGGNEYGPAHGAY